jgi:hypothetical protein
MEKLSRSEAIGLGLTRYFTGKPCKWGHISERLTSSKACVSCKNRREKGRYRAPTDESRKNALKNYYKRTEGIIDRPSKKARIERRKKYLSKYMREKRRLDKNFCFKDGIRRRINKELAKIGGKKSQSTEEILGCTIGEFRKYIESQFKKGMGWHNRDQWHIDHIVPMSSAKTEEDIIALNHHTNLRPIWASENLRKSNKMEFLI